MLSRRSSHHILPFRFDPANIQVLRPFSDIRACNISVRIRAYADGGGRSSLMIAIFMSLNRNNI